MKRIVVFCGSSSGNNPAYQEAAAETGRVLASRSIELVYGGGAIGLMGIVADSTLTHGGSVTGVIPRFLATKEIAHAALTNLEVVETMHDRKARMNELCDGVIVLPGGIGTMEEFFEMFTWGQLGLHRKPIGILNTKKFYDPMIALIDSMVANGFVREEHRQMLIVSSDIEQMLLQMSSYVPPPLPVWITADKT